MPASGPYVWSLGPKLSSASLTASIISGGGPKNGTLCPRLMTSPPAALISAMRVFSASIGGIATERTRCGIGEEAGAGVVIGVDQPLFQG